MKLLRSMAMAAMLALLPASEGAYGADSGGPLRVHVYPGNMSSLYAQIGVRKNFYADAGLDIELVQIATGPQANAALVGGSVDVVLSTPDNMLSLKTQGMNPVAVVGNIVQPLFVLVASDSSKLPNFSKGYPAVMDDLVGKQVGVYGLGGSSDRMVKLFLRGAGKPDDAVQFTVLGGPAQSLTALSLDSVAATSEIFSVAIIAELSGFGTMLIDCSRQSCPPTVKAIGGLGQAYWMLDEFLAQNEERAAKLRKAHLGIDAWVHDPANMGELRKIIGEILPAPQGVDPQAYIERVAAEAQRYFGTSMDEAGLVASQEAMVSTGEIKSPVSIEGMIWKDAR